PPSSRVHGLPSSAPLARVRRPCIRREVVHSRRAPCETRAVDDRVLAIIAILLGVLIGVVLLVPFVALSYRRRGGLTVGRAALWFAGLVYFCAIWTYTLLPLPDPDTIRCAGVNLDLFAF